MNGLNNYKKYLFNKVLAIMKQNAIAIAGDTFHFKINSVEDVFFNTEIGYIFFKTEKGKVISLYSLPPYPPLKDFLFVYNKLKSFENEKP